VFTPTMSSKLNLPGYCAHGVVLSSTCIFLSVFLFICSFSAFPLNPYIFSVNHNKEASREYAKEEMHDYQDFEMIN